MFLDERGNAVAERSRMGPLASGVPGSVAGLLHAQKHIRTAAARQGDRTGDRARA